MKNSAQSMLILSLVCIAGLATAADDYLQAKQRGQVDAANPETRAWYLQSARPTFGSGFGPALNACAQRVPQEALSGFGVVFTISGTGEVEKFYWKSANPLAACLEPMLRKLRYEAPPKAPFYFGLEAQLGASS
jgi:hypothetical protein